MAATGQGITILDVKQSLEAAGYGDVVERSELTKKRMDTTRQDLEIVRGQMLEDGEIELIDDLDLFMAYILGWQSALRKMLDKRSAADKERKKLNKPVRKEKYKSEPIDFSKGDPIKLLYPE